jgi:hypothetical protein
MLANVTVNQTSLTTRSLYSELLQEHPSDIHYSMLVARGVMVARVEVQVEVYLPGFMENSTWGLTVKQLQDFVTIPGATFSTLLVNGTDEWDGSTVRCLLYTTGGTTFTNNFTVVIGSALPTTYTALHTSTSTLCLG